MLSPSLAKTLRDLAEGRQVSRQVERALDSCQPTVPTAQRFEFCKALLDIILQKPTSHLSSYFPAAISCLRDLAPLLKAGDASVADVVARVEKYTVKFALLVNDAREYPDIQKCALRELETTLRLLFEPRGASSSSWISKSSRRRLKPYARSMQLLDHKENDDPQARPSCSKSRRASGRLQPVEVSNILTQSLFPGASELSSLALLPGKDSALVSRLIAGALTIRLTSACLDTSFGERIYLIKAIAVPWLRHLQSFPEPSTSEYTSCFTDKVCRFLGEAISNNSCELTKARATALILSLRDPPLNVFATDLHQAALKLINTDKRGLMQQEIVDVVVSIYEDGLQYISKYPKDDPNWVSEDLSIWFDHVLQVWARINAKSLPDMFYDRAFTLCNTVCRPELLACLKLQVELFDHGAYTRKAHHQRDSDTKKSMDSIWKNVELELSEVDTPNFFTIEQQAAWEETNTPLDDIIEMTNVYIRFLRVLDPLCSLMLSNGQSPNSCLLSGSYLLLQRYVSATVMGLQFLASPPFSANSLDEVVKKRLIAGMNKMVGGALEAAKELLKLHWFERNPDRFCNVIACIAAMLRYHSIWYMDYVGQWWDWFLKWLKQFFEEARRTMEASKRTDNIDDEEIFLVLLQHCDKVILSHCKGLNVHNGRLALLRTLRRAFISRSEWHDAFNVSREMLLIEFSLKDHEPDFQFECARHFVQDIIRVCIDSVREGTADVDLRFLEKDPLLLNYVLGLFIEYQCHTRLSVSSFRSRESYLEVLFGLQRSRYRLFEQLSSENDCALLQVHRLWLTFVFGGAKVWSTKMGKRLQKLLASESDIECNGHIETAAFGFKSRLSSCSSLHIPLLTVVADIWRYSEEGNYHELGDLFSEVDELKTTISLSSYSREFVVLSAEILDWASFTLALQDYDLHALRARTFAEECREVAGIPRSDNAFLRDLCFRVANSVFYNKYLDGREHNDWSPELKEAKLKFADWNFNGAVAVLDCLEDKFPPYEIALAHEFGSGDIISALLYSHKALKSIVRRMAHAKECVCYEERKFHIGGANINIGVDVRVEAGQELMREVLELINILFQYARLYFEAESINLGQYYMERCYALAKECLPHGNYTLASILAAYHAKVGTEEPTVILKKTVNARSKISSDPESGRNVVSEHEMWSHLTVCRYRRKGIASVEDILSACNICEQAIKLKSGGNHEWAERAGIELRVLKAIALANAGEGEKALELMKPLLKRFPTLRISLRVFAHYHMARSMWRIHNSHGPLSKTPRKRTTRSRAKNPGTLAVQDVENAIDRTVEQLTAEFNVPWICRRVYGLRSLKINNVIRKDCAADISLLAQKIGASFNVRWRFTMRTKMEQLISQGLSTESSRLQQLEALFQNMTIGELGPLQQLIKNNNCVVVGIDIDDAQENLVVWRICRNGTFLGRGKLPTAGPSSVRAILDRINDVVSVKRDSSEQKGKLTNKEKSDWWADRFRLDEELEAIVTEIELVWIGELEQLLDPKFNGGCHSVNDRHLDQVVLLVDTQLERIPWESIGILREGVVSVTRAPSLAFLEHFLRSPVEDIEQHDMFYLINPTGEFTKTEGRFRELTQTQTGWTGFCGKCTREDVANTYNGQRMYMYCGHGTGVVFMSPRRFEKAEDAPVTLLMGCSSARPDNLDVDDEESNGAAVDMLIRGAPAVVGTLWDVSDGEIDRFTLSLLSLWTGASLQVEDGEFVSLAESVARSRSACRTPYLVGAACVVMGAPNIHVKPTK